MIASGSNRVKKKSRALHLEGRKDTLRHCQNWLSPTPYNPESALGHLIQLTGTPWAQPLMTVLPVWEMSELWGHGGVYPDFRGGPGGSGNVRQNKTFWRL